MVEAVSGRLLPRSRRDRRDPSQWNALLRRVVRLLRWCAVRGSVPAGLGIAIEARTSYLQSSLLSRWTAEMNFTVQPGPSNVIRFPKWGPYDERLGYAQLPSFIESLSARHFAVARQARWSPPLERLSTRAATRSTGRRRAPG